MTAYLVFLGEGLEGMFFFFKTTQKVKDRNEGSGIKSVSLRIYKGFFLLRSKG